MQDGGKEYFFLQHWTVNPLKILTADMGLKLGEIIPDR